MARTPHRLGRSVCISIAAAACVLAAVPVGAAAASEPPSTRVVGGTKASTTEYPWVVFLTNPSGFQFCGGTLVTPTKVVTAAHCTQGDQPGDVRVVSGRDDKQATNGVVSTVSAIWVHPQFRSVTEGSDVSVLTLERPLSAKTLPLAAPADSALYAAGTEATVLGWGTTGSGGSPSRYLLKAAVPVTSDAYCSSAYGSEFLAASMVCAGYEAGGVDTCQGDSGGPMTAGGKLIGITSWGEGCAKPGRPGVYARVSPYYELLTEQLETAPTKPV